MFFQIIALTVTVDDSTVSDSAVTMVTVNNVVPEFTSVTVTPSEIDENGTVTFSNAPATQVFVAVQAFDEDGAIGSDGPQLVLRAAGGLV